MCRQTSRDVEAESTETVRLSPVAKVTWIGTRFLDLTAWGQTKTQVLYPGGSWTQLPALVLPEPWHGRPVHHPLFSTRCPCWLIPVGSRGRSLLKPHPVRQGVNRSPGQRTSATELTDWARAAPRDHRHRRRWTGPECTLPAGSPMSWKSHDGWHHPTWTVSRPYLQLQPGGRLRAHPVGTGASQALSTEGPVADWPLTNEVQQILVGEEGKGTKTLRIEDTFYLLSRF